MTRGLTWLLAGAALSLSAGAALAADPKPAPAPRTAAKEIVDEGSHAGPDRHAMRMGHGHSGGHLSAILQLRPDQEPALKAYLEAVKPKHEHRVGFDRAAEQRSTLARLDEMEARMAEHQGAMRARIAATRTFYAALDERQKRAFDDMPMMMFAGPGFGPMPLGPMAVMHRMPKMHPMPGMHHFDSETLPPQPPMPPEPPAPPRSPR
ncbi:MAG: Spy/CpxP family protein refolding chaperone [Pseudomonadota bacterium]